jgi:hypothetical protein
MTAIDNETLVFSAEEAQACRAEIEAVHPIGPLRDLDPSDTYKLWCRNRTSAAYQRLLDKLALVRYRRPVIVVRDIRPDAEDGAFIYEAHLYMDGWIELWDCTGELYGIKSYCFKSYYRRRQPEA